LITRIGDIEDRFNWLAQPMVVPLMSKVGIGDRDVETHWKFVGGALDKTTNVLILRFANEHPKLVLRSIWRARHGLGPVEHWIEFENLSGQRLAVTQQDSLSMHGLKADGQTELWWINRGGSNASTQGGTFQQPVNDSLNLTLISNSDDGASPVPWVAVQVGHERGLYAGWEFSGIGRIHARAAASAGQLDIDVGNQPGFRTDVEPGEVFLVPAAFVGCYQGDLDDGAHNLHRFVLEQLRPTLPESCPDPILAYNLYLDVGGANAKEADVLRCAKLCHELSFEAFMPDAMWFPETGDWQWDSRRFPNGILPIEKQSHSDGVLMALWCGWTNGGVSTTPGALSVRGPTGHPEWFNADFSPDWKPGPFFGGQICLGCPEAKQWAIEKTQWLVGHHKLDYLKHDCGPITNQCNKTTHRHRYGCDASYWATMGYYEVQDKLRKTFPKIILENCSGGGTIKDFGIVQRTHYTVTTDTLSNLPDRQSIYDSTFALPPLVLQAYTYDNVYPVKGDSPGTFLWRSGMMSAWQIDPSDTPTWKREDFDMVKRSVQIYKEWIRPILHDCKVHHILPRPDGIRWDGMFYWSESLRKGTFYIFRPGSNEEEQTIKLKGLNPERRYWVWGEDGSIFPGERTGTDLMEKGLAVKLPQPYTSDLIYLQDATIGKPNHVDAPEEFRLTQAVTTSSDPFSIDVSLSWEPSAGARSYRVVISELSDLSKPILDSMTIGPCMSACTIQPEKTFYWKVEALGWGGRRWNSGKTESFTTPRVRGLPGVTFVSDMQWAKATAGAGNSDRRDANYYGKPVSVTGKIYKKAVWTHAFPDATPADVVLDISGKNFSAFAAETGVENASGGGSVQFQVLVDGQRKAESPILRQGQVHAFHVDVTDAKEVILRVLNGGDGYANDHAAWGYARFIHVGARDPVPDMK
jgi:alpha-galactosidase